MRRASAFLAMLLLAPWLFACAPMLAPPGPAHTEPHLIERPLGPLRLVTADGYELLMRRWMPEGEPRAVILALHGFNDHSTFVEDAALAWEQLGIATYAYDQRGFGTAPNRGLWAGSAAYKADASAALRLLAARHPGVPLYLLGESMGGAIAMVTLAEYPDLPVEGAVLAAPAVWARETMPGYQRIALLLASYSVPWFPLSGKSLKIQASDNLEALRELSSDPLVIKETRVDAVHGLADLMDEAMASAPHYATPSLLLYGAKDELVPEEPMLRLWRRLSEDTRESQRLALYDNGWHLLFRDLEAGLVIEDVAVWISDPTAPLPSAADAFATERLAAAQED